MPHIAETDIFRTRPSFTPYFFIILGIAVLVAIATAILAPIPLIFTLAIALIGLFALVVVLLAWSTTEYALTTQKVHVRRGIITRYHEDIEITRVSSIELHQTVLGRIFNLGDIVIDGDSPNSRIVFHQIAAPSARHKQIEHETLG